jgi:Ca2+-binding EF-hand superfamily protein
MTNLLYYKDRILKKRDELLGEMFSLYDLDQNGYIQRDEILYLGPNDQIIQFYNLMDKNGDSKISLAEFRIYYYIAGGLEITDIENQIRDLSQSIQRFSTKYTQILKQIRALWIGGIRSPTMNYFIGLPKFREFLEKFNMNREFNRLLLMADYNKDMVISYGEFVSLILRILDEKIPTLFEKIISFFNL